MIDWNPDHVKSLAHAENQMLQILVSQFCLTRNDGGTRLSLEFGRSSPTIWRRQSKQYVSEMNSSGGYTSDLQSKIDGVLIDHSQQQLPYSDDKFVFRYGNGGSLPIIRLEGRDYFCMNYRPIHPVGWNIANGGAEGLDELLNPEKTIERELREELIVINKKQKRRYVFRADMGKAIDHPDLTTAWKLWEQKLQERGVSLLASEELPMKWIYGPDSLSLNFDGVEQILFKNCFINITTEDSGIEVDRVSKIKIPDGSVICFGEIYNGKLVPAVIGLFEVEKIKALITGTEAQQEFIPDIAFFDAGRFEIKGREDLAPLIDTAVDAASNVLNAKEIESYRIRCNESKPIFDLCPIARRMIHRFIRLTPGAGQTIDTPLESSGLDVFICFGHQDEQIADRVHQYLRDECQLQVFYCKDKNRLVLGDFTQEIDYALERARYLVVVGTDVDILNRRWVRFEWRCRHAAILSGNHAEDSLVSLYGGAEPYDLPLPLRMRRVIQFQSSGNDDYNLSELHSYLS
jgi:TIR domain